MTTMETYVDERLHALVGQAEKKPGNLDSIAEAWRELHRAKFSTWMPPESACRFLQIDMIDGASWQVPYHEVCVLLATVSVGTKDAEEHRRAFNRYLDAKDVRDNQEIIDDLSWDELLGVGMIQIKLASPPYAKWWRDAWQSTIVEPTTSLVM